MNMYSVQHGKKAAEHGGELSAKSDNCGCDDESASGVESGSPYMLINAIRVLLPSIAVVFSLINIEPVLLVLAVIYFLFSFLWLLVCGIGLWDEEQHIVVSSILPCFFDVTMISILVYYSGSLNSVAIVGYCYIIAVCSLNMKFNQGLYSFVLASVQYPLIGLMVFTEVLPAFNFFGGRASVSLPLLIAAPLANSVILFSVYAIIHSKLAQMTGQIQQIEKQSCTLSEKERQKTQYFANISHEFRTPLTLIRAPLEAIIQGRIEPSKTIFDLMHRNCTRLLSLISDFLDISRIEEGCLTLNRMYCSLSKVVENTMNQIASSAEYRGITLKMCIEDNVYALIDASYFEKALYNLLSNALKFTGSGGNINVILKRTDARAQLQVADTGIGIAEDKLGTIFNRYVRAESRNSRNYEGSGIGLAFAKEIIDLHEGTISVKSEEGKGSVFSIVVCALPAPLTQSQNQDAVVFIDAHGKKLQV